eukprot:gb/GECG01001904.1/.p1 GENE.gb/GECG01001904.1/~~gb/GECG01001904.1/.p1  ORF type:complete len:541 (+),score=39.77 gb/GECG01001904.1/:1-1623(+)
MKMFTTRFSRALEHISQGTPPRLLPVPVRCLSLASANLYCTEVGSNPSVIENPVAAAWNRNHGLDVESLLGGPLPLRDQPRIWPLSKIQLLNEELCKNSELNNVKLYRTQPHKQMLQFLRRQAGSLNKGYYRNRDGVQSRLLVGPRGIGKSTTCRAFSRLCTILYPDVIPIYLSFEHLKYCEELQNTGIDEMIVEQLCRAGLQHDESGNSKDHISTAIRMLEKHGKRCQLILDELDEVYAMSDKRVCKDASLNCLRLLGAERSGHFATTITGSSGHLPLLITADIEDELKQDYPQLKYVGSLNGTKFEEHRIRRSTLGDADALASLFPDYSLEGQRIGVFFSGTFPRQTEKFCECYEDLACSETEDDFVAALSSLTDFVASIDKRDAAKNTWTQTDGIVARILVMIYEQNQYLFDKIETDGGGIDIEKVGQTDWEQLKPIPVECVFEKVPETSNLALRRLLDRGWFIPGDRAEGRVYEIFPAIPYHAFIFGKANQLSETADAANRDIVMKSKWCLSGSARFDVPGLPIGADIGFQYERNK